MAVKPIETKIPVAHLKLGMHVVRLDRHWTHTNFPIQGVMIRSLEDIEELRSQCEFVYIETRHHKPSSYGQAQAIATSSKRTHAPQFRARRMQPQTGPKTEVTKRLRYVNEIPMEQELSTARSAFESARNLAKSIMSSVRLGSILDVNHAKPVVAKCVQSVLRNEDALLWLTHIKHRDEYTAEHSMNVCILSAAFAKHLGLSEKEIQRVALGALLHDVGKTRIDPAILNKEDRLTPEEMAIMRQHPQLGYDILISTPGCEGVAADVALSHHETVEGSGYPNKLHQHQISFYAKLVSITDAYDAITSNRCYAKGRTSKEALDIIYRHRGQQFDEELALAFIQCIGIYPPGTLVEMHSGEVGIVVSSSPNNKLRPKVLLLLDADKQARPERLIDLMKIDLDAEGESYSIKREWPNGSFGINLQEYLDRGALQAALEELAEA